MVGRDDKGRFVEGHSKTGGRKTRLDEDQFNKIWSKKFPQKRVEVILDKLGALAERGDLAAIKLVLEYLYGKPIQRNEVTGYEGGALEIVVTYENKPPTSEAA